MNELQQGQRRREIERQKRASRIPPQFSKASLQTYDTTSGEAKSAEDRAVALARANNWFNAYKQAVVDNERIVLNAEATVPNLAISGLVGTTKSTLAACLLNDALELMRTRLGDDISVRWWGVNDLLHAIGAAIRDDEREDPEPDACAASLLVLDDIGRHRTGAKSEDTFATAHLYDISNARLEAGLPTIITYNGIAELNRALDKSVKSRLIGTATLVETAKDMKDLRTSR